MLANQHPTVKAEWGQQVSDHRAQAPDRDAELDILLRSKADIKQGTGK